MNAWVKSFIVINLLLSALFCAFTMVMFTNRQDWKLKYHLAMEDYNKEKTIHQEDNLRNEKDLGAKQLAIDGLQRDLISVEGERDKYQLSLKTAESDLTQIKGRLEEQVREYTKLLDNFNKKVEELRMVQEQLEKAREVAQGSRRLMIDLREQVVAYERERSKLSTELLAARSDREKLEGELKQREWMLKKLKDHGYDITEIIASAGEPDSPIHGKILAVKDDAKIVLVSVGQKDNVKEGYKFTVYRGADYIGKIQVESVYPNYASARIIEDLLAQDQKIMEGDNASTRVY